MDRLERFLTGDEEALGSYPVGEFENFVQLLSDQVQSLREQVKKAKSDLQNLEAETAERRVCRELFVSRLAQAMDLQEALEEEDKTQQQLRAAAHEMERLSEAGSAESCEVLETRLKEAEELLSTCHQQEEELLEEVAILKTSLEKSQAALGQMTVEHQAAETELHALQDRVVVQSDPAHEEVAQALSKCVEEMGLLKIVPEKRHKK